MKKPPAQVQQREHALKVEVQDVTFVDAQVLIQGYGELRSLRTVDVAAEVAGTVIAVHPRLQVGEIIEQGEVLFVIDDRDYLSEYESSRERLKILERDAALATSEFTRLAGLLKTQRVGSQSAVDRAEQAANAVADRLAQVRQAMVRAEINLARCRVEAPFTARITAKTIEQGQYVSPGRIVLGLADDSFLELEVSLDSRDVSHWLRFDGQASPGAAWFGPVSQIPCQVSWVEEPERSVVGELDRISRFNPDTRTVDVVIRLQSGTGLAQPLVAGMFCAVEIPGKTMSQVVALPRWAVSFENTVYLARDGRLLTVPVKVARAEGDLAYVDQGLQAGDQVIVTRLIEPLENSLLQIMAPGSEQRNGLQP
ncbi:MAG: efflux RND transporter periplasmic adaptor subunit [Desulfobulbaceae bacterium]|uniref:Efflux RND transporter periplasmic adaptor subunit n=1 Tax=Candidatus Desulfatifera sulfidica TaxID=2841691 RepID=A0A8J6N8X9_9BACT|nr:efflux RND transporter periplasmic adaptor subunit [Candidatus Desulfatifera sulfidica]